MSLIDTLIVGKDSKYGLTRDALLLADAIARCDGGTTAIRGLRERSLSDRLLRRKVARRIVHIERVFPRWYSAADEHWLLPNQERFPHRHLHRLRRIDRVLAKTRHAYDIFSATGAPTVHFGFMSDDCLDAGVERDWNGFFHLAGGSTVKGTEDLLALWARHPDWPRLHLVQKQALAPTRVPSNVELITRHLSDEDLRRLQNQSGMHLCPSRSEGWGHHLVEAMSCGALVLTTDAPPMNEHIDEACGVLVTSARQQARHLGTDYFVDPAALEAAVARMIAMPAAEKMARGQAARRRYLATVDAFHSHVAEMFAASKNVG